METKLKVCIRSSSSFGIKAYELIRKNFDFEIIAFMEDANFLSKSEAKDIPVQSQYTILKRYKNKEVDKIIIPGNLNVYTLMTIERELKGFGVWEEDIIIIPAYLLSGENRILAQHEKQEIMNHHEFNYLKYLEFHVADHCNLKCDNCCHFSNLVKEPVFPKLSNVRKDFERVRELVDNIQTIRILGGESLLNPELHEYIEMVKEIFPCSKVSVVTNGILLRKMTDDLVECILKNDVLIDISSYPPLWETLDKNLNFLQERGIRYHVSEPVISFDKVMNFEEKIAYPYKVLLDMNPCMCKNLYNGKMAICATACYSGFYDQHYNTNKMEALCQKGIIDIYKVQSFRELQTLLDRPCELCDYCTIYRANGDFELQEKWHQTGR